MNISNKLLSIFEKLGSTSEQEEAVYDLVADEIEKGFIRRGLWTKSFSQAGGDKKKRKQYTLSSVSRL